MILEIKKNNRILQAYKEIGITRNIIITVYELIKFRSPVYKCPVTSHKYVTSSGTDLSFNTIQESDLTLIKKAEELINSI